MSILISIFLITFLLNATKLGRTIKHTIYGLYKAFKTTTKFFIKSSIFLYTFTKYFITSIPKFYNSIHTLRAKSYQKQTKTTKSKPIILPNNVIQFPFSTLDKQSIRAR